MATRLIGVDSTDPALPDSVVEATVAAGALAAPTEVDVLRFGAVGSQTAIEEAMTAAAAAGMGVFVPSGEWALTTSLAPPSGTHLRFAPGAELIAPAGASFHAVDLDGVTDVRLINPRVRKQSGAAAVGNIAGIAIRGAATDIVIDGGDVSGMGRGFDVDGVTATAAQRITLRDCTSHDAVQFGLCLSQCDVVTVNNFRSYGSGLDGIKALYQANNVTIDGFHLTGATGGDGIDTYGGGGTWRILNGTAEANGNGGIIVKSSTDNSTKTATITAADDLITRTAHNHTANTPIVFSGLAGAAPLVNGTTYYVRDVTANAFKVAATVGGAAIDITSDGTGTFRVVGAGFMEQMEIDNIRCVDNGGYGFSIHRHSADSLDNTDEPLPAHILVGSVIANGNGGYGVYMRANGVQIGQIIACGNDLDGIMIDAASIDVTVMSWYAAGNSVQTPGTDDGFNVEGGTRIRVGPGTALGAWVRDARSDADITAGTATQRYGLRIDAAATSYTAHAPNGGGNLSGLFSDASGTGWVLPSTSYPQIVMPNNQQFLTKTAAGVNVRAVYMSTSDVVEFGNTSTPTTIRASTRVLFPGKVEMDGELDHDGTTVGFYGVTPVARAASPGTATGTDAAVINAVVTALRNLGLVT